MAGSLLVDEGGCPHVAAVEQRSSARSIGVVSARARQCLRSVRTATKHPRAMLYRRLMIGVVVVNLAVLGHSVQRGSWQLADGSALAALSTLTLVNLTVAVLVRNQAFLNALYGLAGRGSPCRGRCGSAGAPPRSTTSAGCTSAAPLPGRGGWPRSPAWRS